MLRKVIKYNDLDGNPTQGEFYFHLSKADVVKLQVSKKGGLEAWLRRIVAAEDESAIISEFENLIRLSAGKKSDDGKRFIRDPEVLSEFFDTDAYSEFFMELCTNAEAAAEFINGIIPDDLAETIAKVKTNSMPEIDNGPKPPRILTKAEAEAAKAKPIKLADTAYYQSLPKSSSWDYPVEEVRKYLEDKYTTRVAQGGLEVYTTINVEAQKIATKAIREGLRRYDRGRRWRS